mmetsp:Transcript_23081/g.46072  ORF Transcript_23081/g.46072 Transcript_23081/m.46072 type:complete len:287 (+) Transcript_23081:80-940(+)
MSQRVPDRHADEPTAAMNLTMAYYDTGNWKRSAKYAKILLEICARNITSYDVAVFIFKAADHLCVAFIDFMDHKVPALGLYSIRPAFPCRCNSLRAPVPPLRDVAPLPAEGRKTKSGGPPRKLPHGSISRRAASSDPGDAPRLPSLRGSGQPLVPPPLLGRGRREEPTESEPNVCVLPLVGGRPAAVYEDVQGRGRLHDLRPGGRVRADRLGRAGGHVRRACLRGRRAMRTHRSAAVAPRAGVPVGRGRMLGGGGEGTPRDVTVAQKGGVSLGLVGVPRSGEGGSL